MKRVVLTFLSIVLGTSMIFTGCGSSAKSENEAPAVETAEATKEDSSEEATLKDDSAKVEEPEDASEVEESESVSEAVAEETAEASTEVADSAASKADTTLGTTAKAETTTTVAEGGKNTATNQEPAPQVAETSPQEIPIQEAPMMAQPATVQEPAPSGIWAYVKDGVFDYVGYGASKGAVEAKLNPDGQQIGFFFSDGWFVEVSTSISTEVTNTGVAYIGVGRTSDYDLPYVAGISPSNDDIIVSNNITIPRSSLDLIDALINYMLAHPDPNQKPSISGVNFVTWEELYP